MTLSRLPNDTALMAKFIQAVMIIIYMGKPDLYRVLTGVVGLRLKADPAAEK